MVLINYLKAAQERFLGKDSHKSAILILLILLCAGATYYFHFILRTGVVFTSFFLRTHCPGRIMVGKTRCLGSRSSRSLIDNLSFPLRPGHSIP